MVVNRGKEAGPTGIMLSGTFVLSHRVKCVQASYPSFGEFCTRQREHSAHQKQRELRISHSRGVSAWIRLSMAVYVRKLEQLYIT